MLDVVVCECLKTSRAGRVHHRHVSEVAVVRRLSCEVQFLHSLARASAAGERSIGSFAHLEAGSCDTEGLVR